MSDTTSTTSSSDADELLVYDAGEVLVDDAASGVLPAGSPPLTPVQYDFEPVKAFPGFPDHALIVLQVGKERIACGKRPLNRIHS